MAIKKKTISEQTVEHTEKIKSSAADAAKVISDAASAATKVIADAAAVAVRVVSVKNADDHDLLIELKTRMEDLRKDIKELNEGTSKQLRDLQANKLNIRDSYPALYKKGVEDTLNDHETRVRKIEEKNTQIITWGVALIVFVGIIEFVINVLVVK